MKKIFFYPFLVLFATLVFFSFSQKVLAAVCPSPGGLEVVAGEGRCSQAGQALTSALSCLAGKDASIQITSIGDEPSKFDACVSNWNRQCSSESDTNCCSHHKNSCHYGGAVTASGRACSGSQAVDFRISNKTAEQRQAMLNNAQSCGFYAFIEGDHIHASVNGGPTACNCGEAGNQSSGIWETIKYQSKDICIDFNTPIPGIQEFLTKECPYPYDKTTGNVKYLVTSETVGLYINAVYKYGAGLAGVVAMFMIVFAAWQWIIAAGNAGKISNAKDTIIGALIGLALLFGGYLLLSQISSRLVDLGSLDVQHFDPKFLAVQNCQQTEAPCGQVTQTASGATCLGQTCSAPGQTCMEFGTGWTGNKCPILKDDLGLSTYTCTCQLPPTQLNCDIFRAFSPTCGSYTNASTCSNNFCNISDGPCLWEVDGAGGSCYQVDDVDCDTDNDCATVKNTNGDMVDTCCDTDDYSNNCEFPVDYRLAHPEQFGETNSPQADNCGD